MTISAVIITKNEEENIGRCIKSLEGVVDEVIIYDSGSNDQTVSISESLGAKVVCGPWKGFSQTKNTANSLANGDYILSLDADEALSEQLKSSILHIKPSMSGVYRLSRITKYCNKWIKHCGWYPEYKLRIFPNGEGSWEGSYVHEKLVVTSEFKIKTLKGELLHYSYKDIEDHINRVNYYSSLVARAKHEKGKRASMLKLLGSPIIRFLKMYVFYLGFLDGYYGFVLCKISAYEAFLRYAKLREIQQSLQK